MKKYLLATAMVVAFFSVVSAQAPVPFSVHGGGLISVPNAPDGFKDSYKNGFHGMLGLGYKAAPIAQIVGKAEYHHFGYDFSSVSGVTSGAQSVWMYGADLRVGLNLPAFPIKPYLLGGGGLAHVSYSPFEGSNLSLTTALNDYLPPAQNKFYYNIGGGLDFKLAPMLAFFAQARYVEISTDGGKTSYVPITLGIKLF